MTTFCCKECHHLSPHPSVRALSLDSETSKAKVSWTCPKCGHAYSAIGLNSLIKKLKEKA